MAAIRAAQLGMKTAVVEKDTGRRALPELRVHPGQGGAARRPTSCPRSTRPASSASTSTAATVDFAKVVERREKVDQDAHRRRRRPVQEEQDRAASRASASLTGDGKRQGRRRPTATRRRKAIVLATGSVPKPIPGTEFGGRVIGTEEAWALDELPEHAGRRRRRRVGRGDRLRLRAARHRGAAVRGARPRAADRGRRHLQGRRARLSKQGIDDPHRHARSRTSRPPTTSVTLHLRRRDRRGRLPRHRRRPRARRRGPRPRRGRRRSSTSSGLIEVDGALRTSRRGRLRDRRPRARARRSRTRPPTRASSPSRTPPGCETHPIEYVDIPRATFCTPERRARSG